MYYTLTDEQIEDLAKSWPDLLGKSNTELFLIGQGWYNILDILFEYMSRDVTAARHKLNYASNMPDVDIAEIQRLNDVVLAKLNNLPTIINIRAHSGKLRIYIEDATDEVLTYISFAEQMSSRICEHCGTPGETRLHDVSMTLCDRHHKEYDEYDDEY